ncbi:MAG: aminopeptidase P family protein [Acholeplasmataceae bacterium]|nr:aminopeptidase P family protein [Acholeplasmataceae bacterium]
MYTKRRNKLNNNLKTGSIAILGAGYAPLKTADEYYPLKVNNNFYYLTNILEEGALLVLIKGQKNHEILFKHQTDPVKALWVGEYLTNQEASDLSNIKDVRDIKSFDDFFANLDSLSLEFGSINYLYLDNEPLLNLSPAFKLTEKVQLLNLNLTIESLSHFVVRQRMFKDNQEIAKIKEAIRITDLGLKQIMKTLKPNKMEYEIEAEYNYVINKHNKETSFQTIAASGKNATILHYIDNDQLIPDDSLMLFDLGVSHEGYASDISRTYPTNGKFSARQREIYEIVLKANKESISNLKPGMTWQEYNDFGKNILAEECLKIGLISTKEEISKYYYHSLGHFLGLDTHDLGDRSFTLQPGMVITCEPGLYIASEKIGIRIEDDVLITENGAINLSKNIIKEIDEIERFMK